VRRNLTQESLVVPEQAPQVQVRDAGEADTPALTRIKGPGTESMHRDRLWAAQGPGFRYLVLLAGQERIGLACLVTRRPAPWSDADDTEHLPHIVDLQVGEAHRGDGWLVDMVKPL
jgi:hypothetical protein